MATKILHVGLHKTGTTTLQKTLKQSRIALSKAGFHYPSLRVLGEKDMAGHHALGRLLAEDCELHGPRLSEFVSDLTSNAKEGDTLFLSTESFFRYTIQPREGGSHIDARRRYVEEMAKAFGGDCEVLLTVRRPDNFAASVYQESIKKTSQTRTVVEYAHGTNILNISDNINVFMEFFSGIKIVVFEEVISDPRGLAAGLLDRIGFAPRDLLTISDNVLNVSLHPYLVEYKRLMNYSGMNREESANTVSILNDVQKSLLCVEDKVALLSLEERRKILERRSKDIDVMAFHLRRNPEDVFPILEDTQLPKASMTMDVFEEIHQAVCAARA